MVEIKDFIPGLVVPFIAIYHKYFVEPIRKKNDIFLGDIAELKTDIKWIRTILDKQFNGKL